MVVFITVTILVIAAAMLIAGHLWLTYYGFKYGAGTGIGVLLFPPFTLWFAFYKLETRHKERPSTLWLMGLVMGAVIFFGFNGVVNDVMSGKAFEENYGEVVEAPPAEPEPEKTEKPATPAPATGTPAPATGTPAPATGTPAPATGTPAPATGTPAKPKTP